MSKKWCWIIGVSMIGGFLGLRYAFYIPQAEKPVPAGTVKEAIPLPAQTFTGNSHIDEPVSLPDNQELKEEVVQLAPTLEKEASALSPPVTPDLSKAGKTDDVAIQRVSFGYLRLVGIISSGSNHSKNKAIIQNLLTSRQKIYTLASVVPYGSKIIHIDEKGITLEKGGIEKKLLVSDTLGNPEDIKIVRSQGYKKIAEGEWLITPNSLIRDTENIFQMLSEVSIRPSFSFGKIEGFKLNKVKSGGVIGDLGFVEGDMISTINGNAIDSVAGAYEIYQQIKSEPIIQLGLSRKKQDMNLTYHIISDGPPKYDLKSVISSSSIAKLFLDKL